MHSFATLTSSLPLFATLGSAVTLPITARATGACAAVGSGNTFGNGYTVACTTDFSGFEDGNSPVASFADCAPLCDARSNCIGFSYLRDGDAGVCFFKTAQGTARSEPNVDSAFKSTCTAVGSGNTFSGGYTASCTKDFPGFEDGNTPASSFAACAPLCDARSGCIGFSFLETGDASGVCFFKSAQGTVRSDPNVNSAFKSTCAAIGSGSTFSGGYTASCSTDFPGFEDGNTPAGSFAACAPLCDAQPSCIGFSFLESSDGTGVCFFKVAQGTARSDNFVDSAFKAGSTMTTGASTSTTTTGASNSGTDGPTTTTL